MGIINSILKKFDHKISKINKNEGLEYDEFVDIYNACRPYTMTSIERLYSLYKGVEYIIKNNIEGDFIECGVWRGGCTMAIAMTLNKFNITNRKIFLFDTFEGMSEPTENDVDLQGSSAKELKKTIEKTGKWCYAEIEDVKNNMAKTEYPSNMIEYIKGKVEDTLPSFEERKIALLRLDTDWYESTLIELQKLYPMLVSKGVLIIDDYGHWAGSKKAVDEYIKEFNLPLLLNRVDYSGRLSIKTI